jgi:Carboxypeptidase regulatory-like domain
MRSSKLRFCAPIAVGALWTMMLAAACGGDSAPAARTPPADAKRVDESKAGRLTGRVGYEGPAPENPAVKVDSDPACSRQHPAGLTLDQVVVNNGGLENVFVYVKDGLGNYHFDTPAAPVTLDQKGCRYAPHIFGLRTGQPLEIGNSDQTLHTVHALGKVNQEFNLSYPLQGIKHTKTFTAPEVMVHFKCNVHSWMSAYAGVLSHPYFAVTANGGAFELKNLPAGTYTVEAWHEKLGTQTQSVTLDEKESKAVNFTFKAAAP